MLQEREMLFIINPKSGTGSKNAIEPLAKKLLANKGYKLSFVRSQYKGHATKIAADAAEKGIYLVVAIGGDGTINEIGKALVGKQAALGIIPAGSGNGFARHLGIPLKLSKAILRLAEGKCVAHDTIFINEQPFFNVSGIGFDAYVSYLFSTLGTRGFKSYVKATFKAFFSFKPFAIKVNSGGEVLYSGRAYMVSLANSSQFGNNCYISPEAVSNDGKFEVIVLKPFSFVMIPIIVYSLFRKGAHRSRYFNTWSVDHAELKLDGPLRYHIDGDCMEEPTDRLTLRLLPRSLKVVG